MRIEIFALCDFANESGGKLNLLGAFDQISATSVPAAHPYCTLALRLRFDRADEGDHRIRIDMVDPDGKAVMPPQDYNVTVKVNTDDGTAFTHFILNIQELIFQSFGPHSVDLHIDGVRRMSLPLLIRQAE